MMPRRASWWRIAMLCLALGLACAADIACASKLTNSVVYPGPTVTVTELDRWPDFVTRQLLVGRSGERVLRGEVILQKRGVTLTIIGMTPFGSKAFVIIVSGDQIETTEIVPGTLPFPAEYMVMDISRSLFLGLVPAPIRDGVHRKRQAGEKVVETWEAGKLQRRSFSRRDRRGVVAIDYDGGMAEQPPKTMRVINEWFGYSLEITTVMWQRV